jgi:anti-sigma B factor antagonist
VTSMELSERVVGAVRVLGIEGDVDLETSPRLGAVLARLASELAGPLVVDLTACRFIDSSGLAALLHGACHREDFSIVGGTGAPGEVLRITAIDQTVPVFDELEEALAAAGARR